METLATVPLLLRDGWMMPRRLEARRDIIERYFETITLMAQDVGDRPEWGLEIDLRGHDFTNEAFVALYEATLDWHAHKMDTTEARMTELARSPKLGVTLLQSRAVFLRMMLYFCGADHPLRVPLIDHIATFLVQHTLYIEEQAAPEALHFDSNLAWLASSQGVVDAAVFDRPVIIAEARLIDEAFYNIDAAFRRTLIDEYTLGRAVRGSRMSSGAFANNLLLTRRRGQHDMVYNNLRANTQGWSAPPMPEGVNQDALYRRAVATSLGLVMRTGDVQGSALYTMPLGGTEWLPWASKEEAPLVVDEFRMAAGPEYVLATRGHELRAYRFNLLGRIGSLASEDATADKEPAAMRRSFEVHLQPGNVDIACGAAHVLAYNTDGVMDGCGRNAEGQIGYGHYGGTTRHWDTLVGTPQALILRCGGSHTLLVEKTTYRLWGCGSNAYGQLGAGADVTSLRVLTPLAAALGRVVDCWCGAHFSALLTEQGFFVCGDNSSGQLGLGDRRDRTEWTRSAPADLVGHIMQVSCGAFFMALSTTRGYFVSGGATHTWQQLKLPRVDGPRRFIELPTQEHLTMTKTTKRPSEVVVSAATGSLCRHCRALCPETTGLREVRERRLTYCNKTCQGALYATICFVKESTPSL